MVIMKTAVFTDEPELILQLIPAGTKIKYDKCGMFQFNSPIIWKIEELRNLLSKLEELNIVDLNKFSMDDNSKELIFLDVENQNLEIFNSPTISIRFSVKIPSPSTLNTLIKILKKINILIDFDIYDFMFEEMINIKELERYKKFK